MVEHAHLEGQGELVGCVVYVWWRGAACTEGAQGDGGGEDQGGNVAGEYDDGRGDC